MDEALKEFGIALGKLKEAFSKEYNANSNYIDIHIDSDNNVTIINTSSTGSYIDAHRAWV